MEKSFESLYCVAPEIVLQILQIYHLRSMFPRLGEVIVPASLYWYDHVGLRIGICHGELTSYYLMKSDWRDRDGWLEKTIRENMSSALNTLLFALQEPFPTPSALSNSLASDWVLPMRGTRKRFARGERIESQDVRFPMSSLHIFGLAVSVLLS